MLDYYNVMREMFPNGAGTAITSFTAGTPFNYADTNVLYTNVNSNACTGLTDTAGLIPHMNGFTFWNNPLLNSELIAWVQQDGNKSIMQSLVIPPSSLWPLEVSTVSYVTGINIYPVPAQNEAHLRFNLASAGNVSIKVIAYDGKLISDVTTVDLAAGQQNININTTNIPNGNYIVLIQSKEGMNAERLSVLK